MSNVNNDYFIGEGNKIGRLPSEFDTSSIIEKKFVASGDVLKGQILEVSDNLTVKATTAASKYVLGVAMFDAKSGEPVAIETEGLFKLTASAAINAPALIESSTNGSVVTVGETVTKTIGIALTDAVKDGEVYVKFSI